ncbi:hypothetical protein FLAG1_04570 [Fusarium langsethiae]|uniref:Uncharacterized protein n=1 Tax=Fusarium langsethiae TaxID=179993 RepID=A0A0N0DFF5_FUSLA|nr:hypothetical protein FLAG1_04570 [Fusarium langsethiae]GKU05176.1 unnamed protein product [Fusarium langsethiae]GKU19741.1 unnamed protein product [Fusarium langsethiae]
MDAHDRQPKPERSSIPRELQEMDSVLTELQPITPSVKVEEQSIDNSHGNMGHLDKIESSIQASNVQPAESSTSPALKKVKEQLKTEKEKNSEAKKEHNAQLRDALEERDQQQTLMDGRPLANASKETDGTIKVLWTQIAYGIRQVAHSLANSPSAHVLDDTVTHRLRLLTADYGKFLSSPDHCVDIMQGYLWLVVMDRVFNSNRPLWGGPHSTSLKRAKDCLYERMFLDKNDGPEHELVLANGARCFAQISTMFSELWDQDEALFNRAVDDETKLMGPFFLKHHGRNDRAEKNIRDQLKDIFRTALELDKITLTSRAFFQRRWQDAFQKPGGLQLFNEDYMTSANHETVLTPKKPDSVLCFSYASENRDSRWTELRQHDRTTEG